jgi:outer membrane protein TolC
MAMQNRAEIRVALAAIKASALRQQLALDDLKPQLDAVISTFLSGVSGNKDVGRAYEDSFSNNPSYAVGISFEVPIGRRASNARLQRQELENRRLHQQLQQVLGNVRLDARLAYRDVQSHAAEYQQFQVAMEQASRELQSIEGQASAMLTDAQRAGLFIDDVLQSQARLANTEQQMLNSQTELSIALVRLKRATGQLLQARAIENSDTYVQQAGYDEPIVENHYQLGRPTMPATNEGTQFEALPPMQSDNIPTLATPLNSSARRLPGTGSATYR